MQHNLTFFVKVYATLISVNAKLIKLFKQPCFHVVINRGILGRLASRGRCFPENAHLPLIFLLCYWLGEDVHGSPTEKVEERGLQETSKGTGKGTSNGSRPACCYLGVRISLYCSFSTRVVAATDMGMTILFISKELSPRRLLIGCCRRTKTSLYKTTWI